MSYYENYVGVQGVTSTSIDPAADNWNDYFKSNREFVKESYSEAVNAQVRGTSYSDAGPVVITRECHEIEVLKSMNNRNYASTTAQMVREQEEYNKAWSMRVQQMEDEFATEQKACVTTDETVVEEKPVVEVGETVTEDEILGASVETDESVELAFENPLSANEEDCGEFIDEEVTEIGGPILGVGSLTPTVDIEEIADELEGESEVVDVPATVIDPIVVELDAVEFEDEPEIIEDIQEEVEFIEDVPTEPVVEETVTEPVKNKGGRPKGSKNKTATKKKTTAKKTAKK